MGVDATWALGDFSLAASGTLGPRGFTAKPLHGGGPIEAISGLTGFAGWHGNVTVALDEVTAGFDRLDTLHGEIRVSDLHATNVGNNASLGGYVLHFDGAGAKGDGAISAQISDDGGPLQAHGIVTLTPQSHTGMLSVTLRERPAATPALRKSLEDLAQLRSRDAEGRIPLEIEFAW
jgi:hypothetical protein